MQTAMLTAMRTVRSMPKGAGQQAGPQSWTVTPSPGLVELAHSGLMLVFQPPTQSGASSVLVTVVSADTEDVIRLAAEAVVVSRTDRQISW